MKRGFSTFIAFLLFTLMFFKVSSFHSYSHLDSDSNDIENCKICELAVENHNTDFIFSSSVSTIQNHTEISNNKQPANYELVVTSSFLRFNFFGRPPPNRV